MRHRILLHRPTLALALALAVTTALAQTLTVGTYNIRLLTADDARHGDGWSSRCDALCQQLAWEEPAIFGTQEGYYQQLQDMLQRLPSSDHYPVLARVVLP